MRVLNGVNSTDAESIPFTAMSACHKIAHISASLDLRFTFGLTYQLDARLEVVCLDVFRVYLLLQANRNVQCCSFLRFRAYMSAVPPFSWYFLSLACEHADILKLKPDMQCPPVQGPVQQEVFARKHETDLIHEDGMSYNPRNYGCSDSQRFHIKTRQVHLRSMRDVIGAGLQLIGPDQILE